MTERAHGRLSDGKTARLVEVTVEFAAEGLDLTPVAGGPTETWPYGVIRIVDDGGSELRLGRMDDSDVRLVVPANLRAQLAARAPRVLSRGRQSLRSATLVTGGVIACLALIAAVFLGIPIAARPLAAITPPSYEAHLGALARAQLQPLMSVCEGPQAVAAEEVMRPLVARLAEAGDVPGEIRFHFVKDDTPNAFALPGGQVLMTSGLLDAAHAPDEVAAVLAHELAHVKARDSLEAFYRRFGMAIVLDAITGGSGLGQMLIQFSGDIAELGYTRGQEDRADEVGLAMLDAAGYDPAALGRAFARLEAVAIAEQKELEDAGLPDFEIPEWLSTHPDIAARRANAEARAKPGRPQPLSAAEWALVRQACEGEVQD